MSLATISRAPATSSRTGREARLAIRAGEVRGQTGGLAPGYVQGNLAILPGALAGDFLRFCQLNPKPCPLLGCSFSFEDALVEGGIELRHMTLNVTVPMYRTSIATTPAGPFHGPVVVSMRPMTPADAIRAVQITTRFPAVHGAPVHLGKPELIGIADLMKPDYGDPVPVDADEIPVFWACGVTPQSVVATVKPEFCITHYPGSMLVTDRRNSEFAIM